MIQSLLGGWGKNPLKNMFVRHGILHFPTGSGKKQKSSKFMFQSPPTRKKNMRSVADEVWSTKRSQRFCLWPVRSFDRLDRTSASRRFFKVLRAQRVTARWLKPSWSTLPTGWACSSTDTYISYDLQCGARDDSSVGEHNYSIVCVFFGRCNYTVDRWAYKHTYK